MTMKITQQIGDGQASARTLRSKCHREASHYEYLATYLSMRGNGMDISAAAAGRAFLKLAVIGRYLGT